MQICDIAVALRRPPVATKPISRTAALWGEVDWNELIRVNSEAKRPMSRRNSLIKFLACLYFSERNLNGSKMAPSINGISVFIAEFESWLSGFPQSPALIVESSSAGPEREAVFRRLMLAQQDINYLWH
jgi:hypothetical protein